MFKAESARRVVRLARVTSKRMAKLGLSNALHYVVGICLYRERLF